MSETFSTLTQRHNICGVVYGAGGKGGRVREGAGCSHQGEGYTLEESLLDCTTYPYCLHVLYSCLHGQSDLVERCGRPRPGARVV